MEEINNIRYNEKNKNNNNISLCSICNDGFKTISDPESGEIICEICGIVLSEEKKLPLPTRVYEEINANSHFNTTTNTNSQNHDNNSSNNNILLNIESATIIGRSNVDAIGKKISNDMQTIVDRLRVWEQRTRYTNPRDRNLKQAFNILNNIKDKMVLSNAIVEKSFYLFKKASSQGIVRGRLTEGGTICLNILSM